MMLPPNVVVVPAMGDPEASQADLTEWKLKQVVGGVLIPSQGFSKAMARRILNMEAGREPGAPVPL